MPYINIKITKEGDVTAEQKAALIKGATQLLVDILGKNPKSTVVVIDEVDTDNWGLGGESITVVRALAAQAKAEAEAAKEAEKLAKAQAKAEAKAVKEAEKLAKAQAKAEAKAAKEAEKAAKKAAKNKKEE